MPKNELKIGFCFHRKFAAKFPDFYLWCASPTVHKRRVPQSLHAKIPATTFSDRRLKLARR